MKSKITYIAILLILLTGFFFYKLGYKRALLVLENKETTNPTEGTGVVIDKEQQEISEIKIVQVKKGKLDECIMATGVMEADPSKTVKVSSFVNGKVIDVNVNVGDIVLKGDNLLIIDSIEAAKARADYSQAVTKLNLARKNLERQKKLALLGTFSGKPLEEAEVNLAQERSAFTTSVANYEVSQKNLQRVEDLFKDGISSKKDLEQAQAEYQIAMAEVEKDRAKLEVAKTYYDREKKTNKMNYMNQKEIQTAQNEYEKSVIEFESAENIINLMGCQNDGDKGIIFVKSPINGMVAERNAVIGEAVEPSKPILTVINTDCLWGIISLKENGTAKVKVGNPVKLSFSSFPYKVYLGGISGISPVIDQQTRTIKARVEIKNFDGLLKPEMFFSASITTSQKDTLIIPREAVQRLDGDSVVFLTKDDNHFIPKEIKVGIATDKYYEVIEGLNAGDKIVSNGSFIVKSELLKNTLEDED